MAATVVRIDKTTSLTTPSWRRIGWFLLGMLMIVGPASEYMEAEGGGDVWELRLAVYGMFIAIYAVLPEIGQLLSVFRDRKEIEASRWYAGGFSMVLGGFFLILGLDRGARHGFTLPVLLICAAAADFFISPFFPKLFGTLHIAVDEDQITARTSYLFRSLRRRWPEIERIEVGKRAVRLVTHGGEVDKISLKHASDEQSDQITSALTGIATAQGVPVEE